MKRTSRTGANQAESLYSRAVAYHNGDGVRRSVRRAFAVMEQAARLGSAKAQSALGSYYDYGIGVAKSPSRAFKHYQVAALAGYADAQYNVAACYYDGIGTRKSYRSAVHWLQKAVTQRVPDAAFLLACCYEHGRGVRQDMGRAMRFFLVAAELGHAEAHVEVGFHYRQRNPRKAVEWYRKAAKLGSTAGQYNLASCLERGEGVRKSLKEAVKWYRAATEKGHKRARLALSALARRST